MHTAGSESSECLCNQQFRTGNAKASLGKAAGQYSILLPKAAPNEERKLCASIAMGSPTSQSAGVYPGQREFRVSLHQEFRSWNPWSHHQLKQEKNQSEKPVLPISPRAPVQELRCMRGATRRASLRSGINTYSESHHNIGRNRNQKTESKSSSTTVFKEPQ